MLNRVVLIGRLVADPELRYTQSGIAVANFRVAVDRTYKSSSGEKQTDFIRVVCWRKTAELVGQYLNKGRLVGIDGSLQSNQYETKEGEKRTSYEVLADSVQFLDRKDSAGGGGRDSAPPASAGSPPPENSGGYSPPPDEDDDLPF